MWSKLVAVGSGLVLLVAGVFAIYSLWPQDAAFHGTEHGSADEATAEPREVSLTPEKLRAAKLEVMPAESRTLQEIATVPGRVQYDDVRHVEVRSATEGILIEVKVKPGDAVEFGCVLAVVSSPEVGQARANVLEREATLAVAEQVLQWRQAISQSLERLAAALRSQTPAEQIRRDFREAPLGTAREQLLSAYARVTLAEKRLASLQAVSGSGAVPQRTVQEAESEHEAAAAAFESVLEQSLFDARQQALLASNALADAQRRLQIAQQQQRTLLGQVGALSRMAEGSPPGEDLSLVEIRAPFAGTIERRGFSALERIKPGDSLFTLADTATVWVTADVREREWAASKLKPGDALQVRLPALGAEEFTARLLYVGREVDPSANALPLVATLDNRDGRLRPGMYAQITLPLSPARVCLAVPEGAICEHQGERFVFRRLHELTFERVDVVTGLQQAGWTEIVEGLAAGDPVVSAGAFFLKSELLLEREEE